MANPTSAFGWQMPTNTDLVKDLPSDFEIFGQAVDDSFADLKGGTTGQVLSKTSNTDLDFTWTTPTDQTPLTTKGDLFGYSTADARIPIGTNNQVLTADSAETLGLKWADVPDPKSWSIVQQDVFDNTDDLRSVKYLNGNWVIGTNDGAGAYSTNGTSWTGITIHNQGIRGLAYGASLYIAVGTSATLRSSSDLSTWTSRTSNILAGENINDVIWDGSKFIIVAGQTTSSGNKISTSTNGTTWTARFTSTRQWYSVAYDGVGNYVVVGKSGSDAYYATSTNGTSWTEQAVQSNLQFYRVVWNGTDFIIAGTSSSNTSIRLWKLTTAGVLSVLNTLDNSSTSADVIDFLYDGTNYFITCDKGSFNQTLFKGGSSHKYQLQNFGNTAADASFAFIAHNNGNYVGVTGGGNIFYGTEPRTL